MSEKHCVPQANLILPFSRAQPKFFTPLCCYNINIAKIVFLVILELLGTSIFMCAY